MIGGISFGAWYLLYPLVLFLFIMLALLVYKVFWLSRALSKLTTKATMQRLLVGFSWVRSTIGLFFLGIAGICLAISLLRPQWGMLDMPVDRAHRDVIIALDISQSMLCQDIKPSRLEEAKKKIEKLVEVLPSDRVALILFSSDAYVMCPLTSDHETFLHFVRAIDSGVISQSGTRFEAPIQKAIEMFNITQPKSKILILFTDGEDFSQDIQKMKDEMSAQHIHLFAVGVATEKGAPIPLYDSSGKKEGVIKKDTGEIVISRLQETVLKQFAQLTGGLYYRFDSSSDADIAQIMAAIKKFEKEKDAQTRFTSLHDRFYLFTAVSFVCLLIQWLL